jgi:hypothetical protein
VRPPPEKQTAHGRCSKALGTFDERATTNYFENQVWRPSFRHYTSKEIIINLPACWRQLPIFDF